MENSHDGHRQRLRERILHNGAEAVQPHEIVEFLLFYVMPRRDTNPIAHALLERFETLENVLKADADELTQIEGMSLQAAQWLQLVGAAAQAYIDAAEDPVILTNRKQAREYILRFLSMRTAPATWLFCLNSNGLLLYSVPLDASPQWYSRPNMRILFSEALRSNVDCILLAQKRCDTTLQSTDISHTEMLADSLTAVQITMAEHIIIDSANRVQHYVINPREEAKKIAESSRLLTHWMDEE